MAKTYYTLCVWDVEAQCWHDEFGDYFFADVRAEMADHSAKAKHKRIIKTDGSAADMIAKRDALPKGE